MDLVANQKSFNFFNWIYYRIEYTIVQIIITYQVAWQLIQEDFCDICTDKVIEIKWKRAKMKQTTCARAGMQWRWLSFLSCAITVYEKMLASLIPAFSLQLVSPQKWINLLVCYASRQKCNLTLAVSPPWDLHMRSHLRSVKEKKQKIKTWKFWFLWFIFSTGYPKLMLMWNASKWSLYWITAHFLYTLLRITLFFSTFFFPWLPGFAMLTVMRTKN